MTYLSNTNEYSCPNCEEDVSVPLPASKYVNCGHCKTKLEVHPDAEFYDGLWHDLTTLSIVDEEREHMKRMVAHAKRMEEQNEPQA
jgi:hypothetical protein